MDVQRHRNGVGRARRSRRRSRRGTAGVLIALLALGAAAPPPQDAALSVRDQMPLFMKVLSFERGLAEHDGAIAVALVYQRRVRASVLVRDEVVEVMQGLTFGGRAIRVVPVALDDERDLAARLADEGVQAVYVAPLRATDLEVITRATRARQVVTLSGVPDYVAGGLSVGASLRGGRPQILVNLSAARAEGAQFHSQLLKLAQMVP